MAATAKKIADTPRRSDLPGTVETVSPATLGGRMALARMRKGMTQITLAKLIKDKDGKHKSRATIVQYEKDHTPPSLDVLTLIAHQLDESPAYLAFGEHVVSGISHKETEAVAFPEIHYGKDGPVTRSGMSLSKQRVDELGLDPDRVAAYSMPHDAPQFELRTGDLLIVDQRAVDPINDPRLYVISTNGGKSMEVIETDPHYGAGTRGGSLSFIDRNGRKRSDKLANMEILGMVVSTVRSDF